MSLFDSILAGKLNGGGASSWNDLTDKPFGESPTGGDTLTWDGNTEGLEYVEEDAGDGTITPVMYKLSDLIVPIEDFANGCSLTLSIDGQSTSVEVSAEDLLPLAEEFGLVVLNTIFFVPEDNFLLDMDGSVVTFPTAGIWHLNPLFSGGLLATSVTIPGYTGFPSIKTIEAKYLTGIRFVVRFAKQEDGTITADKTFEQTMQAYHAGCDISSELELEVGGVPVCYVLPLAAVRENQAIQFSQTLANNLALTAVGVAWNVNSGIEYYNKAIPFT